MVARLGGRSLDVLDAATAAAFELNARVGETAETLPFFEELEATIEDARDAAAVAGAGG